MVGEWAPLTAAGPRPPADPAGLRGIPSCTTASLKAAPPDRMHPRWPPSAGRLRQPARAPLPPHEPHRRRLLLLHLIPDLPGSGPAPAPGRRHPPRAGQRRPRHLLCHRCREDGAVRDGAGGADGRGHVCGLRHRRPHHRAQRGGQVPWCAGPGCPLLLHRRCRRPRLW